MEALCSCVLTTAQDTPVIADAQELYIKFRSIFLQFSKYHPLYDCTTISPDMIKCLGKCLLYQFLNAQGVSFFNICIDEAIKILFATLDCTFGGMKRTVKMYLLADHMSTHQAGCGLMGEQEAESIHAKFTSL